MVAGGIFYFFDTLALNGIQNDCNRPVQWFSRKRIFQLFDIVSVDRDGFKAECPKFFFKVKGI